MSRFNFIDYDSETIKLNMRNGYKEIMKETLNPADPISDFVDYCAYIVQTSIEAINTTGKQNLLEYAINDSLDELGKLPRIIRNGAKKAIVKMRYSFSIAQTSVIIIPKGNRVAVNGLYFETVESKELPVGETYVDIVSECTLEGEIGNGYLLGEIKTIVDPIPYLISATNISTSEGGTEIENDEPYRERIRLGPNGYSVAGPEKAYIYHTKTVNQSIIDVFVTTVPASGVVKIYPLLKNGEMPGENLRTQIKEYLSKDEIRPLTDLVEVCEPVKVEYNIDLTYYLEERSSDITLIKQNVEAAINDYISWQSGKLGRDINPDNLLAKMINAGAKRVVIREPIFTRINTIDEYEGKIAVIKNKAVNYGGEEDE